jgi:glycosyltransferase involved in cell wall biosynthesis
MLAERAPRGELSDAWREQVSVAQQDALPQGRVAVSCPAPFGVGGLGRHLKEIVDALERGGRSVRYTCEAQAGAQDGRGRVAPPSKLVPLLSPLTRFSPPWRMWSALAAFDRRAARMLADSDHVIAFNGAALRQFGAARSSAHSGRSLGLVSATAHIRTVLRQHALAYRQYPLERSWAPRLLRRTLAEYERADRIYVSSQRVWESFVAEGTPADRLVRFPLTPDPRFGSRHAQEGSDTFEIVYVGSLSVVKGVPLLVDAVGRLAHEDLRLVLVGGWETRGMRLFIERARARDRRIDVRLGDPLRSLSHARLYVHPSYDDGFSYSAAEAVAAGVTAIVTDGTGMKDLIDPQRNGAIVPAGDVSGLAEAIDAAYRGELVRRRD